MTPTMEFDVNSDIWGRLHRNIFDHYDFVKDRHQAELVLSSLDIEVITDADGRWNCVKFNMSEEDFTLFLLRWA